MPRKKKTYDDDDDFFAPSPDVNQELYNFADTAHKPNFRSTFIQCASLFMSKEQIATILRLDLSQLENMCKKEFHMSTSEAISCMQIRSDLKTREILRKLMGDGNNTATNIYTTYIDKIQKENEQKALTIKVVGSVPLEEEDDENE